MSVGPLVGEDDGELDGAPVVRPLLVSALPIPGGGPEGFGAGIKLSC